MHSQSSVNAVLMDPHPIWLDAVEIVLRRVGVGVAAKTTSGSEAVRLVGELEPQLLTLEIDALPDEPDGFAVLRQALAARDGLRAIILSRNHETRFIDAALGAGAAAYIVKTAHPDDVASAVRQAFDHSVFMPGAGPGTPPGASSRSSGSWPRDTRTPPSRASSG
jgi:DNA-binding NarL/FixJ family response regulator